jgi:hypothetical protein
VGVSVGVTGLAVKVSEGVRLTVAVAVRVSVGTGVPVTTETAGGRGVLVAMTTAGSGWQPRSTMAKTTIMKQA